MYWTCLSDSSGQRWESCKTHNKALARKILAIRRAAMVEGKYNLPSSNPPNLKDWTTDFLGTIRVESTKRRYGASIKQLLKFFGERTRLSDISVARIEAFKQKRLGEGLMPAGVNRDLAVLRRALNLAARQRLVFRSPFAEVDMLDEKKTRKQPHIVSFEEQNRLMSVASPQLRLLIALTADSGMRSGCEALKITWENIDIENSQITIRESKTVSGRRVVPLTEFAKAELLRYQNLVGPGFSQYVFANLKNPSVPLKSVRKAWSTVLKKAGCEKFSIYDLRHTFGTRLAAAGTSPITVAHLLGHSSTAIVMIYAKSVDEARRAAISNLERFRDNHNHSLRHSG